MNKNDLITIIIPVYNVEKYLEECVKSVFKQSYRNIEIILVNDGSTDSSGLLCDRLAEMDTRIKVLHKKNGGLSDARNYGIEYATGEFIMFVDSDDLINEFIVEKLYNIIKLKQNLKLAICSIAHFEDGSMPNYNNNDDVVVFNKEDALVDLLCQKQISTSACAKLYAKELLNDIRFVKGQRFEDNEFIFSVISKCEKVVYIDSRLYAYRHRSNSITTSSFDEKEFDIIDIGKKILEKSMNYSKEVQSAAKIYQCTNCFRIFMTASEDYLEDERYAYCKWYLNNNSGVIIKDNKIRLKLRIGLLLFKMGISKNLLEAIRKRKNRWG